MLHFKLIILNCWRMAYCVFWVHLGEAFVEDWISCSEVFWHNHSPCAGRIEGMFCWFGCRLAKLSLAVLFMHSWSNSFYILLSFFCAYFRMIVCKIQPPLFWTRDWFVNVESTEHIFNKSLFLISSYFPFFFFLIFLQRPTFQICFQDFDLEEKIKRMLFLFIATVSLFDLKHLTSCRSICSILVVTHAAIYLIS